VKKLFNFKTVTVLRFGFAYFICCVCGNVSAQITGSITDAISEESLIGVNIAVSNNEGVGSITDIDGRFAINAAIGDTLVISYVGYNTTLIPVDASDIKIVLTEASELLDEIVVIGYGAVAKKDLTGVVTKVGADDFNKGSISSPERLLNGKVAGLQISTNGEPGGGSRLRLRGGTSLEASSDPLIVIDGVPLDRRSFASSRNQFNFINAADIESMTVLKDASAAAIYGSRGANGVIIITTKSGKKGKPKLSYSGNANFSLFSGKPNNLSTQNFRNAISNKAPQELEFLGEADTDWVGEVTQVAKSTEHNASISGGTDRFKYHLSGGYLKSNGVLKTSSHEKRSMSGTFSANLWDDKINITYRTKVGLTRDNFAPGVFGAALSFDPTRPVLDPDSEFGGYFQWTKDGLATKNPVSSLQYNNADGSLNRYLNNITLKIDIPFVEGLSFTSNNSYDSASGVKDEFNDPTDFGNFPSGGRIFHEDLKNTTKLLENFFTYKRDLSFMGSTMELTGGHSFQEFSQSNDWFFGNNLEQDDAGDYFIPEGEMKNDSFFVENALISFFGRANFSIKDKYLFTASVRRDGSSRFGPSNQWGLFPAAAFGWRILEEDFASGLQNTFSNLKLRVSYGVTGNEDIADFLFTTFYSFGTDDARYQFGDEYIRTLRGVGVDPNIKWEETSSLNVGLDFGFLNNRVSGSLEVYTKNTNDLLFNFSPSAFTNLSDRIVTNIGEVRNRGIELTLNTVIVDGSKFGWNLDFNVARNRSEILKLDASISQSAIYETGGISGDVGQTIQLLKVGEQIETFRTYTHKIGEDGLPIPDTEDTNGDGFLDNLDMYEDINADGIINEDDLVAGESAAPDVILGLTTQMSYGNWDIVAGIRSHLGNYVYNNVASGSGFFERLTDRVTNNIDESAFVVNFKERQLKSDYYIENASFIRLDNITLGYSISNASVFNSLRIYGTVTNLLTVTGYSGLDPELPQFTGGIDNNLYPVSRNFLIGLNASF